MCWGTVQLLVSNYYRYYRIRWVYQRRTTQGGISHVNDRLGNSYTDKCRNAHCRNKMTVRLSYQHYGTRYTCTSKTLHCISFVSDDRFLHLFHKSYRRSDPGFVRSYGLIIETEGGFHYPAIRSPIECSTLCRTNDACTSFNFNIQNSTCEIGHSAFVALP